MNGLRFSSIYATDILDFLFLQACEIYRAALQVNDVTEVQRKIWNEVEVITVGSKLTRECNEFGFFIWHKFCVRRYN